MASLPIRQYAGDIIESVRSSPVVVVLGETGSGKTTQISQILLDAGLVGDGIVAVTQPRRVVGVGQGVDASVSRTAAKTGCSPTWLDHAIQWTWRHCSYAILYM